MPLTIFEEKRISKIQGKGGVPLSCILFFGPLNRAFLWDTMKTNVKKEVPAMAEKLRLTQMTKSAG